MIDEAAFVHPRAHTDKSVTIGAGSRVWQFASVIRGTVLGERCNVGSCATLDGLRAGSDCIFSPGVDIGPGFLVGDGCFFGPNVVLCNDAWPRAHKSGWSADEFSAGRFSVIVESGASIGANAVILPGVRIGAHAMIAAGAVVSRDVPRGMLYRRDGTTRLIVREGQRMKFAGRGAGIVA